MRKPLTEKLAQWSAMSDTDMMRQAIPEQLQDRYVPEPPAPRAPLPERPNMFNQPPPAPQRWASRQEQDRAVRDMRIAHADMLGSSVAAPIAAHAVPAAGASLARDGRAAFQFARSPTFRNFMQMRPRTQVIRGVKGYVGRQAVQGAQDLDRRVREAVGDVRRAPLARAMIDTGWAGIRGGQAAGGYSEAERLAANRALEAVLRPGDSGPNRWTDTALNTLSPVRIPRNWAMDHLRNRLAAPVANQVQDLSDGLIDEFHAQRALPADQRDWSRITHNPAFAAAGAQATGESAGDFMDAFRDTAQTNVPARNVWDYNEPRVRAIRDATENRVGYDAIQSGLAETARQYPAQAAALTGRVIEGSQRRAEDAAERQALSMLSRVTGRSEEEIMDARRRTGRATQAAGVAADAYQSRDQIRQETQQFIQNNPQAADAVQALRTQGGEQAAQVLTDFLEQYFTRDIGGTPAYDGQQQ